MLMHHAQWVVAVAVCVCVNVYVCVIKLFSICLAASNLLNLLLPLLLAASIKWNFHRKSKREKINVKKEENQRFFFSISFSAMSSSLVLLVYCCQWKCRYWCWYTFQAYLCVFIVCTMCEHAKCQSCHIDFTNCINMHCDVHNVIVTLAFYVAEWFLSLPSKNQLAKTLN